MNHCKDPELIQRIKNGEVELFHELVRPYEQAVYVVAQSVLWNPADAEEVAQESILKAFVHLDQLRDEKGFKPWLLQIARNEARMRRRKDRGHLYETLESENGEGEVVPRDFADWREVPSAELERKELGQALSAALESLALLYREVFTLRDIEQLSISEVAAALGISRAAVKTRSHRARLLMRERLAPLFRSKGPLADGELLRRPDARQRSAGLGSSFNSAGSA